MLYNVKKCRSNVLEAVRVLQQYEFYCRPVYESRTKSCFLVLALGSIFIASVVNRTWKMELADEK